MISLCPDNRLLDNLRECNKLLEQVQKGLSEYLETKRNSFPRFYFLSDDELLEILSQTKDPTAVQPHLRKCFENIARVCVFFLLMLRFIHVPVLWVTTSELFLSLQLKFEDDLRITKMYSGEGEEVALMEELYPRGNVEDWMLRIEEVMKESLRVIIEKSLATYHEVLVYDGQKFYCFCECFLLLKRMARIRFNDDYFCLTDSKD